MNSVRTFSPAARFLLVLAAFVVVVAGMRAAAPLITPFLLSAFISVIAAPPLFFMKNRGLPTGIALLLVIAVLVALGTLLVALIGGSLDTFTANLPDYQARLTNQTQVLLRWLDRLGVHVPRGALSTYLDPGKALRVAGNMIAGLGGVLTNAFMILLTVIFILLEASSFPAKLLAVLKHPEVSMQRARNIGRNINRYMVIKTSTSLITGVIVAVWLKVLGVDFPVLWGTLAFMLNFVPNIGSIIAAVPAVLLALVQLGAGAALWAAVGYLLVNNLIGNMVEPRFMGRGLGLSTLVVFVSLVFWGWVLGPVGMFLSVPLTMTLKIAFDSSPETRAIAVILDSETPAPDVPAPPPAG